MITIDYTISYGIIMLKTDKTSIMEYNYDNKGNLTLKDFLDFFDFLSAIASILFFNN